MPLSDVVMSLFIAVLGFIGLKFLPPVLKKFGFTKYLGDQGMMLIHVGAILYFGIMHVVLPVGSYLGTKMGDLVYYLLPGGF